MSEITKIEGREILDSRGNPTIAVDVTLSSGVCGQAAVPSGASTGTKEALELRDGDAKRYGGKGVLTAVANINGEIAASLIGRSAKDQTAIDQQMIDLDGTENKSRLGANALLGVSMAVAQAAAQDAGLPLYQYLTTGDSWVLPVPLMNIINGGAHATNNLDVQEFKIIPQGAPNFHEALRYGVEVFHALKKRLLAQGLVTAVGDEGGFAPDLASNEAAIELIIQAIEDVGLKPGHDMTVGLDCASSEFYKEGHYLLADEAKPLTSQQWSDRLKAWADAYPIISIEDGMSEDDAEGWQLHTQSLTDKVQLIGDDVFVTNPKIFAQGIADHVANAILIKLNQIGTLTETLQNDSVS